MRQFTITVTVDDESPRGSYAPDIGRTPDGRYTVVICPSQELLTGSGLPTDVSLATCVAHEIGHVLGHEFGFPRRKVIEQVSHQSIAEQWQGIADGTVVRQENEAWDIAEKILRLREDCIKTYEDQRDTVGLLTGAKPSGKV